VTGPETNSEPVDSTNTNSKRKRLIIVGIIVLAVVLVAGSLLTSQGLGRKSPDADAGTELGVKEGDPNEVAPEGTRLKRVVEPPARAHVLLSLPAGTPSYTLSIEFAPYGVASDGDLVIRVTQAEAEGDGDEAAQLARRLKGVNLVVRSGAGVDPLALRGGRYTGTLKTVAEKDGYAFELTKAAMQ